MLIDEIEKNNKQRMEFVKFWAKFVKNSTDLQWSLEQNIIINSNIKSFNMTKEQYMKMKS